MWVDAWQMQCCGDPFAVGEAVSWKLIAAEHDWLDEVLGTTLSQSVRWKEERHDRSEGVPETAARVLDIQVVRRRSHVKESAELTPVDSVDGRESGDGGASLVGYLVTLRPWTNGEHRA